MSTRRLILVALLCGLAILVAGGIQLARINEARDNRVEALRVGEEGLLGGFRARVDAVDLGETVVLQVSVTAPDDGADRVPNLDQAWLVFADLAAQERHALPEGAGPACPDGPLDPGASVSCAVASAPGSGELDARFRVGDRTLVWTLEG